MKNSVQKLINDCVQRFPKLYQCMDDLIDAFEALCYSFSHNGKLLVCGNGGSAADAEHIVGELMKKFLIKRPAPAILKQKLSALGADNADYIFKNLEQGLPAVSLVSHTSLITALVNDIGADMVFAQQVYGYGRAGDILFALSTSGNSTNVVNAVSVARALDMTVIGLTGENGGVMKSLCNITIRVPETTTFKIQELHLPVYHLLCSMVEEEFFGAE